MRRLIIVFTFVAAVTAALRAGELASSRRLAREAIAAYKGKEYLLFLEKSRAASDLRPGHPALLYNVGAALALNGRSDESLDVLERVAAMGVVFEPIKDDDFASIRETRRFSRIVEAFTRNAGPTRTTSRAFTIDDRGIISEGIAYDAPTRRFFVSSARNGVIYARDRRGRMKKFATEEHHGIFGMAVDAPRRILWAAASTLPQGPAAVLEIDLDSGRILRTIGPPDEKHLFGDVAVARDGRVFVSDSISPVIYVIDHETIEPLIHDGPFGSLQGLAISSDGRLLYAADYARGIFAIDLATLDVHLLTVPSGVTLIGVDGLYALDKSTLIATQNGTNPQRVIRIRLAGLSVQSVDVLAANEPDFDDITLGVPVGKTFYFNAVSQWGRFGEDGKQPDPAKLKPALVLRVAVPE